MYNAIKHNSESTCFLINLMEATVLLGTLSAAEILL